MEENRDGLASGADLRRAGWSATKVVFTQTVEGRPGLKLGRIDDHVVYSDESAAMGGEDEYPSPLSYLAMATGW